MQAVVDIVFLMDATGSMANCIQKLKENVMLFFKSLTEKSGNNIPIVKDWRAKVVGFRDYEADGAADWLVDNPFTRDIGELERQLDALEAIGGGDAPESLLDAIYTVATTPKSEKGDEDSRKWRNHRDAARAVIAFTDAPFKPVMVAPGCNNGTVKDLSDRCVEDRILLTVIAPSDELPGCEDYRWLDGIRYASYLPIQVDPSKDDSWVDRFFEDRGFQFAVHCIARTLRRTMYASYSDYRTQ